MSGRRIVEQTASYSQVTLSGDCISVLFIRLCPVNERYRDFTPMKLYYGEATRRGTAARNPDCSRPVSK
jgi:hypothetical protein